MKTSTLFKRAKALLSDYPGSPRRYICYALDSVGEDTNVPLSEIKKAKRVIIERLGQRSAARCLETWLQVHHGVKYNLGYQPRPDVFKKLQTTRRAWLDSLIAEFKAKGD